MTNKERLDLANRVAARVNRDRKVIITKTLGTLKAHLAGIEEQYLVEMKKLKIEEIRTEDLEMPHCDADDLLIRAIRRIGWNRLADAYEEINKWYA